uniref:peptidylprolyl isomerase n=1 Tax=Anopheles culicifacies TaxID=139723 RepID=A0A182LZP2_9DIPT
MLSKIIVLSCLVAVAICESKLKVDVVSVPEGCTTKSKNGDMLTMHYTGKLTDGTKFDSSVNPTESSNRNKWAVQWVPSQAGLSVAAFWSKLMPTGQTEGHRCD